MSGYEVDERRRTVLKATAAAATVGAVGVHGAAGVRAQEATLGDWLSDVSNFAEVVDETGADEVRISVGAAGNGGQYAFDPPAVRVDPGTTVVWEWTGEGGSHDVVATDGAFESDLSGEPGFTFDHGFEEAGVYRYACGPHQTMGMKGAVVVGDVEVDVSAAEGGDGSDDGDGESGGDSDGGDGASEGADADRGATEDEQPFVETEPDYGDWFDGVDNFEGTVDRRGEDEVRVAVGAAGNGGQYAFDPPAVQVDPGTTVVWEWTGEDDLEHDVVAENGGYESGVFTEAGDTYALNFDGDGISKYVCSGHAEQGMKGGVAVGDVANPADEGTLKTVLLGVAGAIVAAPLVASRLVNRDDDE